MPEQALSAFAFLGREAQRTALVRASDDRGVHTTSGRDFPLPGGGALVDGPGIRGGRSRSA
jgi:ribosome biogenesis GTPase